jgi:hypothetical protein
MLLAFQSAKVATESILAIAGIDDLAAEYERRYRAAFDRRLRACSWLRRASFVPFLAELTIAGLNISSTLKTRLVRSTRTQSSRSSVR